MIFVDRYVASSGKVPITRYLDSVKDVQTLARIQLALRRLATNHPRDDRYLGDGLWELRLHFGPGYRVYYAPIAHDKILLLTMGMKKTQVRDIHKAKQYLIDWSQRRT